MLGHVVVACLGFEDTTKLFSRVAVPIYILPAMQQHMNDSVSMYPCQHFVLLLLLV